MGALLALEKLETNKGEYNVLKEIDYFSTVSGGGFAAATYISTMYDHIESGRTPSEYSLNSLISNNTGDVTRNLERGYHNDLARALIKFKCMIGRYDRGDYLEKELDEKILNSDGRESGSLVLGDVFVDKGITNKPTVV